MSETPGMSAGDIARTFFAAAMRAAETEGQDRDAVARAILSCAIVSMLKRRRPADVRAELIAAADNIDPDIDYAFMRP